MASLEEWGKELGIVVSMEAWAREHGTVASQVDILILCLRNSTLFVILFSGGMGK